jgi:hypothetical protein
VASQRGPEKPVKIRKETKIVRIFIRAAYRSSPYASVANIRIDVGCQHFLKIFLRVLSRNTLGRPAKSCDELFLPPDNEMPKRHAPRLYQMTISTDKRITWHRCKQCSRLLVLEHHRCNSTNATHQIRIGAAITPTATFFPKAFLKKGVCGAHVGLL